MNILPKTTHRAKMFMCLGFVVYMGESLDNVAVQTQGGAMESVYPHIGLMRVISLPAVLPYCLKSWCCM